MKTHDWQSRSDAKRRSMQEKLMKIADHRSFPDPPIDVPVGGGEEQVAVLAGGCFWCVEAVLQPLSGVIEVTSGYAGGSAETADYRSVCSGTTGHAEVVQVRFDPRVLSFGTLLKVFFIAAHDPTQVDRQGADIGTQYRSAVFYADERQKEVAAVYIDRLNAAGIFDAPIATRLEPLTTFYPAETYHWNYAERNPEQPYIACTVPPKLGKLRAGFADLMAGHDSPKSAGRPN